MTRKAYENIKEIINPEHTALIVWDVQTMLVERIYNKDEFLSNMNRLIAKAREKNMPIFFTKITPLPHEFESPARKYASSRMKYNLSQLPKEAFELAIIPKENEVVLNKNTASVFIGTNFELMARNAGIETLVIAGISTEVGVESSARDAVNRGFYTIVASDSSSSTDKEAHQRSLLNMAKLFDVVTTAELIKYLS
ncbi:cysteine hydrolase [Candidatus Parvarchaeota archaeon]|nr:cysteine hydrolase [Candidatus Parvarchaeota archaeon]